MYLVAGTGAALISIGLPCCPPVGKVNWVGDGGCVFEIGIIEVATRWPLWSKDNHV